jgi:hypothetical protein
MATEGDKEGTSKRVGTVMLIGAADTLMLRLHRNPPTPLASSVWDHWTAGYEIKGEE